MHMMSKKKISSEVMDTVRRSRTPTVLLTANGEVHTHEEAQVFVHDLNLFVTVQLLDETLAVLSPGKLSKTTDTPIYEWVSGQKPRLTKDGKTVICKRDNLVPLVVPGLSTNLESSSSSASLSQDSLKKGRKEEPGNWWHLLQVHLEVQHLSEVTNYQPGDSNKKRSDRKNSRGPLADLPDWSQDFKEILKETELHASAYSFLE